jgi:anaerobic magnesium-protoporphyrin IX monomethyl ester cyclase
MNIPSSPSFQKKDGSPLPDKVCLIIPPSGFLMDERVFMTLGILKVAAVLKESGVEVSVIDLSGFENFLDIIRDYASRNRDVHHFGITTTTPQLPPAVKIAGVLREVRPDVKIILGGPHVTLVSAALKKEKLIGRVGRATAAMNQLTEIFDVIVAGDGEHAIKIALEEKPPKIVDADQVNSRLFLTNSDLTNSPWPARELVDIDSYHYSIDGVRAITLIGQLGCPFGCGFCGGRDSPAFRRIRMRTLEDIVDEMVFLYETYGFRGFMLYDDELNVNTEMPRLMRLITEAQKARNVVWHLRGFVKSQLFDDEQAAAMYAAGFRWMLVGFESGSEKILKAINKKATRAQNTRCMEIARRHGLKVKALMSIGHPGESKETIQETRSWLLETKPDDFDVTIITAYPGTPYYDQAIPHPDKAGVWVYTPEQVRDLRLYQLEIDFAEVAEYYKGDPDNYRAFVYTDTLSPEDIVAERNRLEKEVREILGIPYNKATPGMRYEHSMGQGFPGHILRTTK